jgi:hypothetical protein
VDHVRLEAAEDFSKACDRLRPKAGPLVNTKDLAPLGRRLEGEDARSFQAHHRHALTEPHALAHLIDDVALQTAHVKGEDHVRHGQRSPHSHILLFQPLAPMSTTEAFNSS